MTIICSYCEETIGQKAPYEDNRLTHGVCPRCFEIYAKDDDNKD